MFGLYLLNILLLLLSYSLFGMAVYELILFMEKRRRAKIILRKLKAQYYIEKFRESRN